MALTLSRTSAYVAGNKKHRVYDVTFPNPYVDNGISLAASEVGLSKIEQVLGSVARSADGATAVSVSYDHTNSKLLAFVSADGTVDDEAGAVDLSTYTARLTFIGY